MLPSIHTVPPEAAVPGPRCERRRDASDSGHGQPQLRARQSAVTDGSYWDVVSMSVLLSTANMTPRPTSGDRRKARMSASVYPLRASNCRDVFDPKSVHGVLDSP